MLQKFLLVLNIWQFYTNISIKIAHLGRDLPTPNANRSLIFVSGDDVILKSPSDFSTITNGSSSSSDNGSSINLNSGHAPNATGASLKPSKRPGTSNKSKMWNPVPSTPDAKVPSSR